MSTQIIGHTTPNGSVANVACTAEEVLAGMPFHGTVFQKRQSQKIYLARIPSDDPITIERAREEIPGFEKRVAIHTIARGEAHEIMVNVGVGGGGSRPTGPTDIMEQKAKDSHESLVRERHERRMTKLREDFEQRIKLRDDRIEAERQKRRDVEDELAELRRRQHEELQQIRREHRQEIEQMRRQMESLRDEKTDLYIESQLRSTGHGDGNQVWNTVVENFPTIFSQVMRRLDGRGVDGGSENAQSDQRQKGRQLAAANTHAPSRGSVPNEAAHSELHPRPSQDSREPVTTGDGAMTETPTPNEALEYHEMSRDQRCGFLVGQVLAVAAGKLDHAQYEATLDDVIGDIESDGELTISDWANMVAALGHHAHHAGLGAEEVGEAVRPLLRRYVDEGSQAELALKRFPAKQAANMLIAATGHDPEPPVQAMVEDVLAYYKQQL